MRHRVAILVTGAVLAGAALAGCASGGRPPATSSPAASSSTSPAPSPTPALVGPTSAHVTACASLYTRLQQVTAVLNAGSELIASSVNKTELGRRIAGEQQQLSQSAELMARGPVPARVRDADRHLVAALRLLAGDFGRAAAAAARGDLRAAAAAMRDDATVRRIVAASKSIEDTCG